MALLVVAVLVMGIVIAVARQPEGEDRAEPTIQPTETISPTTEPTDMSPTAEPTDMSPTAEPTDMSPTTEPTENGEVGGGESPPTGEPPLAETGGATAPWLVGGAFLIGMAAALWRLSRKPVV